jgi:ABC-2 type transport system ATP-binding protein
MAAVAQKNIYPAASAMAIESVTADYGRGNVLEDVSFDVKRGETFGLIGLNGAGKTTLIKIILGLMEAKKGSVSCFGKASIDPESKGMIAYLPEKFEPPFFLSGFEFVKFSLELYGRPFSEAAVIEAADRIGLQRVALRARVNTYSKGMRQKIGLMGTWLTQCPLLILDEPMSGLDPRARVQVKDEIMACRARGMTVFLSSHILSDMDEMCDRVGVIHDGDLKYLGTPAGLREKMGKDNLERAFLKIIEGSSKGGQS